MDTPVALFPEALAQIDPQKVRLPEARPSLYFTERIYRKDREPAGRGHAIRLYLMDKGIYHAQHEADPDCAEIEARAERAQVGNARAVLQTLMFELDSDDVIALGRLAELFASQPKDTPTLMAATEESVAEFMAMYGRKSRQS